MRKLLVLGASLLTLFAGSPALAALGTPANLGINFTSVNTNTLAVTTTATVNIGDLIVCVGMASSSGLTLSGISDGGLNTYSGGGTFSSGGAVSGKFFYAVATQSIPSGTSVTITYSATSTAKKFMQCFSETGVQTPTASALDASSTTGNTAASSSVSIGPTATLAQAAELAVFATFVSGANGDTFTPGGGYAKIGTGSPGTSFDGILWLTYLVTAATTAQTFTATIGLPTSRTWTGGYSTFKQSSGAGATPASRLPLLGVGGR